MTHLEDKLLAKISEAIWKCNGGIPRLLYEIARPNTNLSDQQSLCRAQARAVLEALAS